MEKLVLLNLDTNTLPQIFHLLCHAHLGTLTSLPCATVTLVLMCYPV